jgi:hypothetical protein
MPVSWIERHAAPIVAALGGGLLVAFALIGVLLLRLEQTRDDLERVEGGALLSAVQVQAFRDSLEAAAPEVGAGLDDAITGLEEFGTSSLSFDVAVDDTVPFETEIVLDREIVVPVETSIPIDETIETTIEVQGPLGVAVPIDVEVPIRLDVPVDVDVTLRLNETVPVTADVPVQLDLPVEVAVAETGLADLADSLAAGLAGFREVFANLEGS